MIKLGDKVIDIYSGFKGTVVARTEFINGCVQYEVLPKVKKDGEYVDGMSIDENSLKVIPGKKKKVKKKEREIGGATTTARRMRGY